MNKVQNLISFIIIYLIFCIMM